MSNGSKSEPDLGETLKHCSAATVAAVHRFRETGDPACLPTIVSGMMEHHVGRELRVRLQGLGDELRLAEDLGIDSLTMMEIALQAEDVFGVSLNDRELRDARTLGDFRRVILLKLYRSRTTEKIPPSAIPGIGAVPEGSPW